MREKIFGKICIKRIIFARKYKKNRENGKRFLKSIANRIAVCYVIENCCANTYKNCATRREFQSIEKSNVYFERIV